MAEPGPTQTSIDRCSQQISERRKPTVDSTGRCNTRRCV